jgi:hypothetical protein
MKNDDRPRNYRKDTVLTEALRRPLIARYRHRDGHDALDA